MKDNSDIDRLSTLYTEFIKGDMDSTFKQALQGADEFLDPFEAKRERIKQTLKGICQSYRREYIEHNIGITYDIYDSEHNGITISLRGIYSSSSQVYVIQQYLSEEDIVLGMPTTIHYQVLIRSMFERLVNDLEQREKETRRRS